MIDQINEQFKDGMLNQSSAKSSINNGETKEKEIYEFKFEEEEEDIEKDEKEGANDDIEKIELKKEKEKKEVQEFFRELTEEEPLEGILKIEDSSSEKPKLIEQVNVKKQKEKKKEKIVKEEPKIVKKKITTKDQEFDSEQQEKRDLEELLNEINEGQETGQLRISSNVQVIQHHSEEDQSQKAKEQKKKPNSKDIKKESKNLNQISKETETHEADIKNEVKKLFKQLEEKQEEGILKPSVGNKPENEDEKSQSKTTTKASDRSEGASRPTKSSTSPIHLQGSQEAEAMSEQQEKEEVRKLFKELEEEQVEGILRESIENNSNKPSEKISQTEIKPQQKKNVKPPSRQKVVASAAEEPKLSPEELEKRELKEFYKQLEEEQEEGILQMSRNPNLPSRESSASNANDKKSASEKSVKTKRSRSRNLSSLQENINETLEEQEKRELKELFLQLEDDEEEGILRLADERATSQLSRQSVRSQSKQSAKKAVKT